MPRPDPDERHNNEQESPSRGRPSQNRRAWIAVILVALAAVLMGLPTLAGGFLQGDDIQLVRDHVLVNHPSIEHAIRLFRPDANRDLYQPIPLLSFAMNFAVVHAVGLTGEATGPWAGAWLFHLTNVLLHAANASLVWWLLARWSRGWTVPLVAGLLFAVHPLNVEAVAWLNGRMMLTSTLFALAALIAFDQWLARQRWPAGVLCVLLTALAMMCKVRAALPVLMVIPMFVRGRRPPTRAWIVWGLAVAVTGGCVLLNVSMSRGLLAGGAEALEGSGIVRTVIAMGWYLRHFVLPVGLAPWHPAPNPARWSDPALPMAAVWVVAFAGVLAWSARTNRVAWLGAVWFLATIAVTLPFVPTRNLLVAERYMYLPAIGLFWIVGSGVASAMAKLRHRHDEARATVAGAAVVGVVCAVLIGLSWRYGPSFRTSVDRQQCVAERYPDEPGVWVRLAEAFYDDGQYRRAVEAARRDLEKHPGAMRVAANQIMGLAWHRLGESERALAILGETVAAAPRDLKARMRLATVLKDLNRDEEAAAQFRRAAEQAPLHNPAWLALATLSRQLGQVDEARAAYAKILENNPYDVNAPYGLAELDMQDGDYAAAARRLAPLVSWAPENVGAWTNLGVCYVRLGRTAEGVAAYREALRHDPGAVAAATNLATLLAGAGRLAEAEAVLRDAMAAVPDSPVLHEAYHDVLIARGQYDRAAEAWARLIERTTGQGGASQQRSGAELTAWHAWALALGSRYVGAERAAREALARDGGASLARASLALAALARGDPEAAVAEVEFLLHAADRRPADVANRLLRGLELYSQSHPQDPFPVYLATLILLDLGQTDAARSGLHAFEQMCQDPAWQQRATELEQRIAL